jgi:competence protein ComEA
MSSDWTTGAAKTAGVFVLGAASAAGLMWSLFRPSAEPVMVLRSAPTEQRVEANAGAVVVVPRESAPGPVAAQTHASLAPVAPAQTMRTISAAPEAPPEPAAEPTALPAPEAAPAAPAPAPPPQPAATRTININTASGAELELLPGIGPALAGRILEHRAKIGRFRSVDQLDDIKGIGPKVLAKLRPLVRVE